MAEIKKYLTPVFRGSFTQAVFTAESFEGGAPKHGLAALFTPEKFSAKDKERWDTIMKALDDEAKARFKKGLKDLRAMNAEGSDYKLVPRDGKAKAHLEGYGDGVKFANLTTKLRPGVVDKDRKAIAKDQTEKELWESQDKEVSDEVGQDAVYPGAYYRATVTVYSYDNKGKGVALGLMNLQKIKDGPRIDGRSDAAADFEDEVDEGWLEQNEDDDFLND